MIARSADKLGTDPMAFGGAVSEHQTPPLGVVKESTGTGQGRRKPMLPYTACIFISRGTKNEYYCCCSGSGTINSITL